MIKKLKQADILRENSTIRILMYYDNEDNNIYVDTIVLDEDNTYTDRTDCFPSDEDEQADMFFIYKVNSYLQKYLLK